MNHKPGGGHGGFLHFILIQSDCTHSNHMELELWGRLHSSRLNPRYVVLLGHVCCGLPPADTQLLPKYTAIPFLTSRVKHSHASHVFT